MASTTAPHGEALLLRPPTAEEPSDAARGALGSGLLSGSDGAEDYGTLQPPTKQASWWDSSAMPVTWEDWSGPWWLLAYTVSEVGSILFALLCMLFMVWMKERFTMECVAPGIKEWETCLCEYTKSYVRLFPLIGLVVALAVASRTLLRRHFFYQMLKHRVVVRLQSKSPLSDWLFLFLVACLLHVLCHFTLDKVIRTQGRGLQGPGNPACWTEGHSYDSCCNDKFGPGGNAECWNDFDNYDECCFPSDPKSYKKSMDQEQYMHLKNSFNHFVQISMGDAKMFNLYYCAPAICFMIFLWMSYDVEQTLLPLSKFMEGDAEQARERLTSMSVINEGDAHRAVKTGLSVKKDDDDGYQMQTLCRRLAGHAEQLEQTQKALDAETGGAETPTGAAAAASSPRVERVDFTKSWWIAELMIDRQLPDNESRQFRHVWYVWAVLSLLLTAMVAACFMFSMYWHAKKLEEAWEEDFLCVRRLRWFCACFADLLHLFVVMHVGAEFVMHEWAPLTEAVTHIFKAKKGSSA